MSSVGATKPDSSITSYKSFDIGGSSDIENKNATNITSTADLSTKQSQRDKHMSSDEDNDIFMPGFHAPTPRSPDDDIAMALQETTDDTCCTQCLHKLITVCCGCCCCCVYTQSASQSISQLIPKTDLNYISQASPQYWIKYPFMKLAHRMWKIYFLLYLLLAIPYIYLSHAIFTISCTNSDINHALGDVIDLSDSSSNFCNLYYWIYIWCVPLLFLIIAYITERVTLHNDMRGDRLICLLNIICLLIIIYMFVFFNRINDLLIDYVCVDYQESLSISLRTGCKDQIKSFPVWVLCNTIYLIFICINTIHERVISLYLTLYDFKPKIVRHRASQMYLKRQQSSSNLRQKICKILSKRYWNKNVIKPLKTTVYHVVFNIFHLDRHNMKLGLFYVWSEVKRNNFSFFIGLFTVFISCFVASFLPAVNDKSAIVFVKLAENSVGENDMLLMASWVAGISETSSSSSTSNNNTHNETLSYIYNDDWMYDLNIDNISAILAANNVSMSQFDNLITDVPNVNNNLTQFIMNITGLSWQQLNGIISFWNDNNDNIGDFLSNNSDIINGNAAALNLSDGSEVEWSVTVDNELMKSNPMLNYTFIADRLRGVDAVSGTAPRWWLLGNVTAGKSLYAASTIVMAIDCELELEAGIGRAWKDIAPLEDNAAYIMNTMSRAMNISDDDAVGEYFTMFANLGGIQDSFDLDFAAQFLNTNNSVAFEHNLIDEGIAFSCISVNIYVNERENDYKWMIYDDEDDGEVLVQGNVYQHTNSCIRATKTSYIFRIDDIFGNGFNVDGYYRVKWDQEAALYASGSFKYGSYDVATLSRPSRAYGKSRIILNDTQREDLTQFLDFILSEEMQRAVFNGMIEGNGVDDAVMNSILPEYNTSEMVNSLQNASYNESVSLIGGWLVYYIGFGAELRVARSVESGAGKWSSLLGSVTVIDAQELADIIFNSSLELSLAINNIISIGVGLGYIDSLSTIKNLELISYYLSEVASTDIYEYALQTIVMYSHRLEAYMGSMLDLEEHMISFSNSVFNNLGYSFSAMITLPIYTQMQFITFFKLFLNEMLFNCIVLMTSLVLIVIYSLLLNDVEERTYTYGMLRALGMKRVTLIQIMLLKAITFSIPATFIALIFVQIANIPLIAQIEAFASISLSIRLPSVCYINGLLVGFLIPLIAIYVPTSRALSKTLRDSLDVYHHVSSDIKITMIRLSKLGFSVPIMGVAMILVSYGVICSILVPISIYYQSKNVCFNVASLFSLCFGSGYDLFFGIFGSILLSMIYGMCIIAALISQPLASLIVSITAMRAVIKPIILKNLHCHSSRNIKTSVMFITTLSFCIFAGVSNSFLTNSAVDFFAWLTGADFEIYAYYQRNALPIDELSVYLNQQQAIGKIEDYTAITFPISWYANDEFIVDEITVSSLAGTPQLSQWIVGVEQNYLNVMMDRFLDIEEIAPYHNVSSPSLPRLANNADYDVVNILYSDAGRATLDFEENGIKIPPPIVNGRYYSGHTGNDQIDEMMSQLNDSYSNYIDILVSTSLVSALAIDVNDALILTVGVYDSSYRYYEFQYLMKIRAILNKMPGLVMLPYDLQYASYLAEFQNAVISMPQYNAIFAEIAETLNVAIPTNIWQKIGIKMPSDASDNDYDSINEGIRNFVPDQQIEVDNMHAISAQVRGNISLVNDFFLILGLIGIVLSFFILWLSFLANIRNSWWELGVLRSIGINSLNLTMIYIYEALAIILSCIILGTIIGTLTSLILCSQSNLFMMMPLNLDFPWPMYLSICCVALIVAVLGSYLPMTRYIYNNVAAVMRGK